MGVTGDVRGTYAVTVKNVFWEVGLRFLIRCILRGPGGERIVNVVPGRKELEIQVKTGSWAGSTHS